MINVVSKSGDPQVEENLPKELSSPWNGFQVCRQILVPQTFGADSVDPKHRHLMTLLLSPTSNCERLGSTGNYVSLDVYEPTSTKLTAIRRLWKIQGIPCFIVGNWRSHSQLLGTGP